MIAPHSVGGLDGRKRKLHFSLVGPRKKLTNVADNAFCRIFAAATGQICGEFQMNLIYEPDTFDQRSPKPPLVNKTCNSICADCCSTAIKQTTKIPRGFLRAELDKRKGQVGDMQIRHPIRHLRGSPP